MSDSSLSACSRPRSDNSLYSHSLSDMSQGVCSFEERQPAVYYAPPKGTVVNDRYRIDDLLGHGRFSKVFRAFDTVKDDRPVALKVYRSSSEFYEYFRNEVKLCNVLEGKVHPHVVTALDDFVIETEAGAHGVIVYEQMNGDMKRVLNEAKGGLPLDTVRKIIVQIADGLSFLHDNDIIHADIKPENLLTNGDMIVKICDIGSGMIVDEIDSFHVGTIPYIAPELILGVPYDTKIDVWSLGCLMFELYTGECLFDPDMYFESDMDTDSESESDERAEHDVDSEGKKDKSRKKAKRKTRKETSKENAETVMNSSPEKPVDSASVDSSEEDDENLKGHSICETDSEDDEADGYEWELNHFQLCAFKSIVGRIPPDRFRNGQYFKTFYNECGRLRCVPRCIDDRSIKDILVEDFETSDDIGEKIQADMLHMLVLNPDERPTCEQVSARLRAVMSST